MGVKVLKSGLLATIQDLGRKKSQKYGIIVGGAMDVLATRLANILVGNPEGEATIEVTMFGTALQFEEDHLIAITGADLQATVDGEKVAMWRPLYIQKGQVVKFNFSKSGSRAYIAFAGGIEVPIVMDSKSTYMQANIGGYHGRKLQKDDVVQCGKPSELSARFTKQLQGSSRQLPWYVNFSTLYPSPISTPIRILKGMEYERFDKSSQLALLQDSYQLSIDSNRMGYQLQGAKLELSHTFELLSEGVTFGTIQVPTNGQPIILMAERQTIGGYPRIGQVITVDLPRLAQLQPGDTIGFEFVSIREAEQLLFEQERYLATLKMGIKLRVPV